MGIRYQSIQEILEKNNINYPSFGFFNQRGNVIKIAQWQPHGEIKFEESKGFFTALEEHGQKALSFLAQAKEKKSDIVITPEYSFPWASLKKVLDKKDLAPKNGKLWCLGMEGISSDDFETFYREYENHEQVFMMAESRELLSVNEFFSCLAYVFVSGCKTICVIQFKTTAASDKWAELESKGLTTGNDIYYFKDRSTNHCLFSWICADALNQEVSNVKNQVNYQKCIILHPQLNPKPLHESFEQMRKSFLDYSQRNTRILAQNWGKGSFLIEEDGTTIQITDSYSAFYCCEEQNNREFMTLYRKNKSKGMNVAKNNHILVWHMPPKEHCIFYSIDCFDFSTLNNATASHKEPLGNQYMEYNEVEKRWEEKYVCDICSIDWKWLNESFALDKCEDGQCAVGALSHFFAILFGKKMYSELELKDGCSQVVYNEITCDSEEVSKQRERIEYVIEALEANNIPAKFSELKNSNYIWILHEKGNLIAKDGEKNEICVVYIDSSKENVINRGIVTFQNLMGEDSKDRMLLYHISSSGIKYYDKIYNTDISKPELTNSIEIIK